MSSTVVDEPRGAHAADRPSTRLRGSSGPNGHPNGDALAVLGRPVPGATPTLPGTPLPAHRRVLTT